MIQNIYLFKYFFIFCLINNAHGIYKCLDGNEIPETNMTIDQMIRYYNYPAEKHRVETADGYILTMIRIPHGENETEQIKNRPRNNQLRQAVLLQHGFLASSMNWVINLPNQSLGYILADHGFDVWLGNIRGNTYSQKHRNLTINDSEFWNFSWEEMAKYDLPAMIDYILNVTGCSQVVYIGHSQGTLMGFAKFSEDLKFAKKVKLFMALAPVATVGNIRSPLQYLAPFTPYLHYGLRITGDRSFSSVRNIAKTVGRGVQKLFRDDCQTPFVNLPMHGSTTSLNMSRITLYLANIPDDTSLKNVAHFGQMISSGKMQKYDYGYWTNYYKYGRLTPPEYHPENMKVETVIFWSPDDTLAGDRDVQALLGKLYKFRSFRVETFRHVDFLLSLEASTVLYPKMIKIINNCCHDDH